jgi:2-oxoglutarate dehydrogenase E1 component
VFTPKSLLRHPKAFSRVDDFTSGHFREVINDPIASARASEVKRVIVCVGKVYYDLVEERAKRFAGNEHEIAIIRVEQIYPWPEKLLTEFMNQYASAKRRIWCQEEPRNMGAWTFVRDRLEAIIGDQQALEYAGRAESASPAVGSPRIHRAQLEAFLEDALGD